MSSLSVALRHPSPQMEFACLLFCLFFFCESFIIQPRLNLRTPRQPLLHFWNYKITILDLQTERVHFHLRPVALGTALCLINVNITEFAINQAHLFLFEHFILGCWQCAIFFWVLQNIWHATSHTIFEIHVRYASWWSFCRFISLGR